MCRLQRPLLAVLLMVIARLSSAGHSASKPVAGDPSATARKFAALAESGHCSEALPSLRTSIRQVSDKELKRKLGLDGVHCAMTLNQAGSALEFLQVLTREFPHDPDVLYVAVHAYSDLSTLTSQELARTAPSSHQARELLAESFESQGKWDEAEKEYRGILKQDPSLPGIHFRIGRLLLSKPNVGPSIENDARQELEKELEIDPANAGAE